MWHSAVPYARRVLSLRALLLGVELAVPLPWLSRAVTWDLPSKAIFRIWVL